MRLEGRVRDVVPSGDAVVETASGIVFARGGLPGETVQLTLDGKPGRVRRGRIVAVETPSPARVEPPCPYVERCGGCSLMHASPAQQRALQLQFLRDALRKAGAPPTLEPRLVSTEQTLGYRVRARLAYRRTRGPAQLGFRRERSHDIVDIDRCLVFSAPLQDALTAVRATLLGLVEGEGELSLAVGVGGAPVLVLRSELPQPPALYTACQQLVDSGRFAGIALYIAFASKPASFGDAREWSRALDDRPLEGTIGGFSQAHAAINRELVAHVAELAQTSGMRVLELYAGAGNFTVALAGGALSYTAIEQAPAAVQALRNNLAARALTAKVVEADVAQKLAGGPLDVVLLDPPRTGAPGVLPALLTRKPRRIVYVSCDPATLSRDVAELLPRAYTLRSAVAFEMFPQTADLESVVLLERAS
ncbi:MAG: rRNA (Uracil-5-) -methyltransferase RumA [Myxococcaceae bacterium]|nr:rRNA (Uracil-5-) -methyltransferase RumA [Myxococcaceae bacterium]